jgi:hypothetical protein
LVSKRISFPSLVASAMSFRRSDRANDGDLTVSHTASSMPLADSGATGFRARRVSLFHRDRLPHRPVDRRKYHQLGGLRGGLSVLGSPAFLSRFDPVGRDEIDLGAAGVGVAIDD